MSDKPTTEDVRDKFADEWIEGEYFGNQDPQARKEFDRWLRSVKAEAWDECLAEVDATCCDSHTDAGPNPYPYRSTDA